MGKRDKSPRILAFRRARIPFARLGEIDPDTEPLIVGIAHRKRGRGVALVRRRMKPFQRLSRIRLATLAGPVELPEQQLGFRKSVLGGRANPVHRPRYVRLDIDAFRKQRGEIIRRRDRILEAGSPQPTRDVVVRRRRTESVEVNATEPELRLGILGFGGLGVPTDRVRQASGDPLAEMVAFGKAALRLDMTGFGSLAEARDRLPDLLVLDMLEGPADRSRPARDVSHIAKPPRRSRGLPMRMISSCSMRSNPRRSIPEGS